MDRHTFETLVLFGQQSPRAIIAQEYHAGTLAQWLPEVAQLFGVPQPAAHHPEIDTGVHTCLVVDQAWALRPTLPVLWAALLHDLGKGLTDSAVWPAHHGHEEAGLPLVDAVATRLQLDAYTHELCRLVCADHLRMHTLLQSRPGTAVQWLLANRFHENETLLGDFIATCEADARGRTGFEHRQYPQAAYLHAVRQCVLDTPEMDTPAKTLANWIHTLKPIHRQFQKSPENPTCPTPTP